MTDNRNSDIDYKKGCNDSSNMEESSSLFNIIYDFIYSMNIMS